jgi:ribosomal protein S18 acetylase RimI-like enzyme
VKTRQKNICRHKIKSGFVYNAAHEKCREGNIILRLDVLAKRDTMREAEGMEVGRNMPAEFKKINEFSHGILVELLADAYSFNVNIEKAFKDKWIEDDRFFFDNLHIADKCCFITVLEDEAIGFIAWDPRNMPEYAIIGDNCIVSKHKGKGFGKLQLQEAIKRITQNEVKRIIVTTNATLISAQKNYESLGFTICQTRKSEGILGDYIDYVYLSAKDKTN